MDSYKRNIFRLSVYLFDCVDYEVLFRNKVPDGKITGDKVTLRDVLDAPGECMTKFSLGVSTIYVFQVD